MSARLVVVADDHVMGELRLETGTQVAFSYAHDWQTRTGAYPLSLSMPLAGRDHSPRVVVPFLHNLLPDNDAILAGWGRRFHVSPRNAFALLSHVGEDCAGAIQILRPDRVDAMLRAGAGGVQWLSDAEIAERLRELRRDAAWGRRSTDSGQFSLAGAQPKTALFHRNGRWGVPSGRRPTTHILKPGTLSFDGFEANEHFCLELAGRLGLPRARSEVRRFEDQIAIVVERYDRAPVGQRIVRLHQEDACQALGLPPYAKYQADGGPSAARVADLIRSASTGPSEDLSTFVGALLFHWITAGTDAHAKNYSLLIGGAGEARLAPLYDLASTLPYPSIQIQKARLAMKVGGTYRIHDITRRQWEKQAALMKIGADSLLLQLRAMLTALPDASSATLKHCRNAGLKDKVLTRLHDALTSRVHLLEATIGFKR